MNNIKAEAGDGLTTNVLQEVRWDEQSCMCEQLRSG